ncbi:hypothetical protein [Streptomyces sp. A1-5]|uniref:hypothetical protein n=1 Tax=Streptomyces sp. A1-5 TaxID=2738410 RepID=UPI002E1D005C
MRAIRGIRRWRHNPLRRRTDQVEAWLALAAALLIAVGAPCAGWFAGRAAHDALLEAVRLEHRQRRPVWAVADRPAPGTPVDPAAETFPQRAAPAGGRPLDGAGRRPADRRGRGAATGGAR